MKRWNDLKIEKRDNEYYVYLECEKSLKELNELTKELKVTRLYYKINDDSKWHEYVLSPKEVVERFFDCGYNSHDYEYVMNMMTDEYYDHSPAAARSNNDAVNILKIVEGQFGKMKVSMSYIFAENEMVAARVLYDVIHTGECMGISATHRHITFEALENFKVVDGKIVESWGYWPDNEIESKLKD